MEIKNIPIEEIIPYERNPRKNDHAVEIVARSIKEFGFNVPILLDADNIIISGHTRLKAAKKLGLKEVPVIYKTDLEPHQVGAFRLMDNKSGEMANWDRELLGEELSALQDADIDMNITGFSDEEIAKLIDEISFEKDDLATEPLEEGYDGSESQIRMVQLFFDQPKHEEFLKMVNALGKKLQIKNITDAIWEVVHEAYKSKI